MSRTFTKGSFSVTVNNDRSIRVRPGDWISKYSDAIYGDPLAYWDRYKRKDPNGMIYIDLDDPNKIKAGELLYHPDPLPGEPRYGRPAPGTGRPGYGPPKSPIGIPTTPGTPSPGKQLDPNRVTDFFRALRQFLWPVTDWDFTGSSGGDLSVLMFAAHVCDIEAKRERDPAPTRFRAIGAGLGLGLEEIAASLSFSPPSYWSEGFIGKFMWAGRSLSAEEFCGGYVVLDFSCGYALGWSMGVLFFGFRNPFHFLGTLWRYFQGTSDSLSALSLCNGALFMGGITATTPNLGVSAKYGYMYQR